MENPVALEATNPQELGLIVPPNRPVTDVLVLGGLFMLTATTRGADGLINTGLDLRGKLPDLIDVSNHIANTTDTLAIVGAGALLALHKAKLATESAYGNRLRKSAALIGTSTLALNAIGEWGLPYGHFTPDPVDFLYGCFGGVVAYVLTRPKFVPPATFDAVASELPASAPARQFYEDKQRAIRAQRPVNQTNITTGARPRNKPAGSRKHHNPTPSRKRNNRRR